MIAPIFEACASDYEVRRLLGNAPVRLYPFGLHYDNVIYPYAVWQGTGGTPENYLAQRPDADNYSIQVDVYADSADEVIAVAAAIRNAIEGRAYVTHWGGQTLDEQTKRYRYSFDVDWIVNR